jgi:hypothetical protein
MTTDNDGEPIPTSYEGIYWKERWSRMKKLYDYEHKEYADKFQTFTVLVFGGVIFVILVMLTIPLLRGC